MEHSEHQTDATLQAQRPAFVEEFAIEGLYGYRSVSLKSKFAATVLIAPNGAGKTTLLAALDAFLKGQFTRFAELEFESITCKLRGNRYPLQITKKEIDGLTDFAENSEVGLRAKAWEIEPLALMELIELDVSKKSHMELLDNQAFAAIYSKLGYNSETAKKQCASLARTVDSVFPKLAAVRESLRATLQSTEILYLPTYRRIELSLPDVDSRRERRKTILARLGIARSGLYTADRQFGLSDISERLRALYSEIRHRSNQGYGKISANVINDLISGDYKTVSQGEHAKPDRESLDLFFERIKDLEHDYRRGPYNSFFSSPDLNRVFQGDVPEDAKPFLNYFLAQLSSVIQNTRRSENLVEDFIASCNRYLSSDKDIVPAGLRSSVNSDDKLLRLNRKNLAISVTSSSTGRDVPIESLSSGEKQMISLFSRLYLYPGPKIVLIDEPELSLSLGWQRQILPDVLKAPTCTQVIAITHSPFIFDNELEPFAGSLKLKITQAQNPKVAQDPPLDGYGGEASDE